MEFERELPVGALAWGVLAAAVVAYEIACPPNQLLSCVVDRALEHPIGKYAVPAAVGVVALHLCNVLPEAVDPIHHLGKLKP